MAYIGYSDFTSLFTKLLVNEFGNDYEGDSYLLYLENIYKYLNEEIDEYKFLRFLDDTKFCIFELEHLLKHIDNAIRADINYKQKLNEVLHSNIQINSSSNRNIALKSISILFDDFMDVYNIDIFNYDEFYISVFGIFVNLCQDKFVKFIVDVIGRSRVTSDGFYFIIKFLRDMIDFKHLIKYVKEFVIYSQEYLENDKSYTEHISVLMVLVFRLDQTLLEIVNNLQIKDKDFVFATLKLFGSYCKEYNTLFIEQIDDKNKKFIENLDVIYALLTYLTDVIINEEECNIILNVYYQIVSDYSEYDIIKKVTGIIKYLVSPIFEPEHVKQMVLSNNFNKIISSLSFCFISKINYVDLFLHRCRKYGFNLEICTYILRLILNEDIDNKKRYLSYFLSIPNILIDLKLGNDNDLVYTYLIRIANDLMIHGNSADELSKIVEFLRVDLNRSCYYQFYQLIRRIIIDIDSYDTYIFEGKSFYESVIHGEKSVCNESLIREYFFARYMATSDSDSAIENEKKQLSRSIRSYFGSNMDPSYRNNYYKILLTGKYFDIYKFDLLNEIKEFNVSKVLLEQECDFLIYNSPHMEGMKLGLLFSIELNTSDYNEVYRCSVLKLTCGDIFQKLNDIYNFVDEDYVLLSHESYIFVAKWTINKLHTQENTFNNSTGDIRNIVFRCVDEYDKGLNLYWFVYILVFSDYSDEDDVYNNVNVMTLKLRVIIELIREDRDGEILNDQYIYVIFKKCMESYVKSFVSFTQFEILDEIYSLLGNKFLIFDKKIEYKEIEFDENESMILNNECFKNKYKDILKHINKTLKGSNADEYYDSIFANQDLNTLVNILSNEKKFYNVIVELFYKYINAVDTSSLRQILSKSIKNPFVAKVFVKLLAEYPDVMKKTIEDGKKLEMYKVILRCVV